MKDEMYSHIIIMCSACIGERIYECMHGGST